KLTAAPASDQLTAPGRKHVLHPVGLHAICEGDHVAAGSVEDVDRRLEPVTGFAPAVHDDAEAGEPSRQRTRQRVRHAAVEVRHPPAEPCAHLPLLLDGGRSSKAVTRARVPVDVECVTVDADLEQQPLEERDAELGEVLGLEGGAKLAALLGGRVSISRPARGRSIPARTAAVSCGFRCRSATRWGRPACAPRRSRARGSPPDLLAGRLVPSAGDYERNAVALILECRLKRLPAAFLARRGAQAVVA